MIIKRFLLLLQVATVLLALLLWLVAESGLFWMLMAQLFLGVLQPVLAIIYVVRERLLYPLNARMNQYFIGVVVFGVLTGVFYLFGVTSTSVLVGMSLFAWGLALLFIYIQFQIARPTLPRRRRGGFLPNLGF